MGLAKASLEANVRYLAACLGPEGIRVNGHLGGSDQDARRGRHRRLFEAREQVRAHRAAAPQRHDRRGRQRRRVLLLRAVERHHRRDHVRRLRLLDGRDQHRRGLTRRRSRRTGPAHEVAFDGYAFHAGASTPSSSAAATTASSAPRTSPPAGRTSACSSGVACWAAPRSPRNSIRAFATRRRATRSACSIRASCATCGSRSTGSRSCCGRSRISCRCPRAATSRSAAGSRRRSRRSRNSRARDADALPAYYAMLDRVADVLRDLLFATPPSLAPGKVTDSAALARRLEAREAIPRARPRRPARRARPLHQERGRHARPLVRVGADQGGVRLRRGRRQLREPVHARARPTCCCTTCSARSTASAANGATRSAAWARSRRRWRRNARRAA